MRVPGPQEQGCAQGLPFPAWGIVTAEEPQAQAERPNSQHFKIPPWKLFGCWRPGLFLDALGRSVFLLLRRRDEHRAQLPACTETAPLPWQHPRQLCALSSPSSPGQGWAPTSGDQLMNCSLYEAETQGSLFPPVTFKSELFSPRGQQPPLLTRGLAAPWPSCCIPSRSESFGLHKCFSS